MASDPRFTSFSDYQFAFRGEGKYSIVSRNASATNKGWQTEVDSVDDYVNEPADACSTEIQSLECHTPCPGAQCGRSYMQARSHLPQSREICHSSAPEVAP